MINPLEEDKMKANSAATKIQAGFRGYRVRKQLKQPQINDENIMDNNNIIKSLKYQDPKKKLEEKSATKIQANIRGYLVRKRNQVAQAAATRIQAGYRGFRTRKQLKETTILNWHKDKYNEKFIKNYTGGILSHSDNFNIKNYESLHRRFGCNHIRVLGISVILKRSALPIIVGTSPRTRRRSRLSSSSTTHSSRPWPGESVVALALKNT